MGEARETAGLSDAAGGRSAGGLVARFALKLARDQRGATAIEYALIVSLIFLVIVTSVTLFGQKTTNMYDFISTTIGAHVP
jgi:pilus assembly protein Flp/PilA